MKKLFSIFHFFVFCCLFYKILSSQHLEITFKGGDVPANIRFTQSDLFIIKSYFSKNKFLYIYPKFNTNNKGSYKIFFKKYKENDEDANILN